MTVTLDLDPELAVRLHARARAEGVAVEVCVRSLLESCLPPIPLSDAIALYDARGVTQGQAALAGVSRAEFIDALGRAGVSAFQYTAEEVLAESDRG